MWTSVQFIISWVLVVGYASLIFAWSSFSKPPLVPEWELPHIDKLYHASEYAVLAWLLIRAFLRTFPTRPLRQLILWGVVLTACYGLTDEFHQAFVQDRTMSLYDALADTLGASIIGFIWLKMQHRWWIVFDSLGRS